MSTKKLDISHTSLSLKSYLDKSTTIISEDHAVKETQAKGTLRAGYTGALLPNGEVVGKCHRQSLARYLQLEEEEDVVGTSSQMFFALGAANELYWVDVLERSLDEKFTIKCEEEIPTSWVTSSGVPVTGRPDIVIFEEESPIVGIELKALAADNAAAGVKFQKPKIKHVLQAAHYSWQLGVPFNLVYTWYSQSSMPFWARKTTKEKVLRPFVKEYNLGWEGSKLYYMDGNTRVDTDITVESIQDYYELVVDMDKQKNLYSRVESKDIFGNQEPFNECDYCPLKDICDMYEHDYDTWVDFVKLKSKGGA